MTTTNSHWKTSGFANGLAPIPFKFQALSASEVAVTRSGDPEPGFTVQLNADGTGTVTPLADWGAEAVVIYSNPNYQQTADFARFAPFYPDQLNTPLDRLMRSMLPLVGLGNILTQPGFPGEDLSIADEAGNVIAGIRHDGSIRIGHLSADVFDVGGTLFQPGANVTFEGPGIFPANIVHFPTYGQSLSYGQQSVPVISTAQRFDNLTFNGGVRAVSDGGGVAARASFVPLIETTAANINGGPAGETPCSGAGDMLKELILQEDGYDMSEQAFQMLGSAAGMGSTTIANLSKPSTHYTRFMADVTAGATLAAAAGKTFKCLAFMWLQGESDIGNTGYNTQLVTLRTNITTDVRAATGQTEEVLCIAYEGTEADTAIEFMQAVAADPNILIAGASYIIPRIDGVHFTAAGSKWFGAYAGRALKRSIVDGVPWKGVMPIAKFRQGKIAEVKFNVPFGPLVFDTTSYAAQTSMGFRLYQADGTTAMTIDSVTITQPDTVRIVASATIPANAKLRYGIALPTAHTPPFGGNLRDSDPTIFDGGGLDLPMHNWGLCFEETLA